MPGLYHTVDPASNIMYTTDMNGTDHRQGGGHIPVGSHARPESSRPSSTSSINSINLVKPGPATLLSAKIHRLPGRLLIAELSFQVPLDYADPDGPKIRLFGRAAFSYEKAIMDSVFDPYDPVDFPPSTAAEYANSISLQALQERFMKPWLVYCEGGPGMGCREPQEYAFLRMMLSRGYQVLFLDYRGTGLSSPVTSATLKHYTAPETRSDHLALFRADNLVRDLEAVRKCLTEGRVQPNRVKWSIMGQSFGGFVILTYLSFYSEGLRECFMTGGMAPINTPPEDVYRATYTKALARNEAYFKKYPEDIKALRMINVFLNRQPTPGQVNMPAGGVLTMHRVLTFGLMFGMHGGLDAAHALVLRMSTDIDTHGLLTRATLVAIEQFFPLDTAPMYALVHEAIYCYTRGVASNWAAMRAGLEFLQFAWVDAEKMPLISPEKVGTEFFFSGEMILPFMFDTFPELMALKAEAHALAARTEWTDLYDEAQLAQNNVPVYAVTYIDDLFVDYELAKKAAAKVRKVQMYETNGLYHNASRAKSDEVMGQLLRLRDDTID